MNVPSEERERVESILLGVRALVYGLNRRLTRAAHILDCLQEDPDLPPRLRELVREALTHLDQAREDIAGFDQAIRQGLQGTS